MGQHHRPLQARQEERHLTAPSPHEAPADPDGDADAETAREAAALEAGRLLFAAPWTFLLSCYDMGQLPPAGPPEIAFAGRSNVGKSSLINALVGQKGLAKASNTPGRTRALNLFARPDEIGPRIVDMPGYGYAKAPKSEIASWTRLVFDYLRGRPGLHRVYLLVDARHGLKATDDEAMAAMDEAAISYQAVLTKADKPVAQDVLTQTRAALARHPAAHPEVLMTSAQKGDGIAELRAAIAVLSGLAPAAQD